MRRLLTAILVLAGLGLAATPARAANVTLDGRLSEWSPRRPAAANLGIVTRDATAHGEYVWLDARADERTDPGTGADLDILAVRVMGARHLGVDGLAVFVVTGAAPTPRSQVQVAIDVDGKPGIGNTWFGGLADTNVSPNAAWEYLIQTRFATCMTPVCGAGVWPPLGPYPPPTSATTLAAIGPDGIEVFVPWTDLGLTTGAPATPLRFTVATFRSQVGNDDTLDVGGAAISNAFDVVSDYGDPLPAGPYPNTWTELSDGTVNYFFDVFFESNPLSIAAAEVYAPLLVERFAVSTDGSGPDTWIRLRNLTPNPLALDGYKLGDEELPTDDGSAEGMYRLPAVTVPANATYVVAYDGTRYFGFYGVYPDAEIIDSDAAIPDLPGAFVPWATGTFDLDVAGDHLVVLDPSNTAVDLVQYGAPADDLYPGVTPYLPAPAEGEVLFRSPARRDTDSCQKDFWKSGSVCHTTADCEQFEACWESMCQAVKPLISEVVQDPVGCEYVEIYNPTPAPIDLTNYYLSDTLEYYKVVLGTAAPNFTGSVDWVVRFPAGAMILPGQYLTIAVNGAVDFTDSTCGYSPQMPSFEIPMATEPSPIPDMLYAWPNSYGSNRGMTNGRELAILFHWDQQSDLVTDVDYVYFGNSTPNLPANAPVDKTGLHIDGPDADAVDSNFVDDTPDTIPRHAQVLDNGTCRRDFHEGTQDATGGNGITGADETSEPWSIASQPNTWRGCAAKTPNAPTAHVIQTNPNPAVIVLGDTRTFDATAWGDLAREQPMPGLTFTWATSPTPTHITFDAASATATGVLVGTGDSVIASAQGVSASSPVTVVYRSIQVTCADPIIGTSMQTTCDATAFDAHDNPVPTASFTWDISSGSAATVDPITGVVTGDATETGLVTVRARAAGDPISAGTTVIEVQARQVDQLVITLASACPSTSCLVEGSDHYTIAASSSALLDATAVDQFGAPISVAGTAWDSSNPTAAADPVAGLLTANDVNGETTLVTASLAGVISNVVTLDVEQRHAVSLTIGNLPPSNEIEQVESWPLSVTVTDQFGAAMTGQDVTWSSSAPTIIAVDDNGLVTAGTTIDQATITASLTTTILSDSVILRVVAATPVITTVVVTPDPATTTVGATQQFVATAYDQLGNPWPTEPVFTWGAAPATVASVDGNGLATGVGEGDATLTATTAGVTGQAALHVDKALPKLTTIVVTPATATLLVGDTQAFSATGYDQYGDVMTGITFAWSSSNDGVATVDPVTGVATGVHQGSTVITAASGTVEGTASLQVNNAPPQVTTIEVVGDATTVVDGGTVSFDATAYDQYGAAMTGVTFTWDSTDTDVATVTSAGVATAVDPGFTSIRARSGSVSGSAPLTVTPAASVVTTIQVTPATATLVDGQTQAFSATAYDQYGAAMTGVTFSWSSSNETVATVTSAGVATGEYPGTATITASAGGINGTATLDVTPATSVITTVGVAPTTASILVGGTQPFTATAYDQYGVAMTGVTFTWDSSVPGVATVAAGLATGVSEGSTVISAEAGGRTGTADLTVSSVPPVLTSIVVSPATALVQVGGAVDFDATGLDQYGNPIAATFTWSVSNPALAEVDATGEATGLAPGLVTIEARSGTLTGTATLRVSLAPPVLTAIVVTGEATTLIVGETATFDATGIDQYGDPMTGLTFTWDATDAAVATVTGAGHVTAEGVGYTEITATSGGITGSADLWVVLAPSVLTTIEVTPASANIEVGQTQAFAATAFDQYHQPLTGITFSWSSSQTSVATVDTAGVATGAGAGNTFITASASGVDGQASLHVSLAPPHLDSIAVAPASVSIVDGDTQTFDATAYDQYGDPMTGISFTWSSSDTAVATVSPAGVATGVDPGTTTITAASGGIEGTATLQVTPAASVVTTVVVTPDPTSVVVGGTRAFTATALDQYGAAMTGLTFTWGSSNDALATVTPAGVATGASVGDVTITATTAGVSGHADLSVTSAPPVLSSIEVTPATALVVVGGAVDFDATGLDQYGDPIAATLTWSSSDTGVATVTQTGAATGLTVGTVTIEARSGSIAGTASLEVSLAPSVVTSIVVTGDATTVLVGETATFDATAFDQYGAPMPGVPFTWDATDVNVASVDTDGLATGVGAGHTEITASADGVTGAASLTVTLAPPVVTTILVAPASATIYVDDTQSYTATALDQYGAVMTGVTFGWSSSNSGIATVSGSGVATGVSPGTVTITASASGVNGTATLGVELAPPVLTTITVAPASASIHVGDTQGFTATARDQYGTVMTGVTFTWSSSNDAIATVNGSGVATGAAPGTVTITASASGVDGTTSLEVTLVPPHVDHIAVLPATATIDEGQTQAFTAVAYDQYGDVMTGVAFTWTSSNDATATVDAAGTATGVAEGSVTITASASGVSGSATLTVEREDLVLTSVVVTPASATILVGGTRAFTATGYDQHGDPMTGLTFTWDATDVDVATVDASGTVTGVSEGTTIVTATSGGVSGSASITVSTVAPELTSIAVTPAETSVVIGGTTAFSATAFDQFGNLMNGVAFTWSSTPPGIATVDASGVATGLAEGTTSLIAASGGVEGQATLHVNLAPSVITIIEVTTDATTILAGSTVTFEATAYDQYGDPMTGVPFTWDSTDVDVATVDAAGNVTGVDAGPVTITASSAGVTGTLTVTITAVPSVITTIVVAPAAASVVVGEDQAFDATALDQYGNAMVGVAFAWASSNDAVATIDQAGVATGVTAGAVLITATADGLTGTANLTVSAAPLVVTTVVVAPATASILEGATQTFSATALDQHGNAMTGVTFAWASTTPATATVDQAGVATGVAVGATSITATASGVMGSATLTVTAEPLVITLVTVTPSTATVMIEETQPFTATAFDQFGNALAGVTFQWSASGSGIASVDPAGLATGIAAGQSTISATAGGISGSAILTVTDEPPVVTTVVVIPSTASVVVGGTRSFTATAFDQHSNPMTGLTFTWSSSDTAIATVNASGVATGVAAGTTTITAAVDGVSGTAALTVSATPLVVTTVTVAPVTATVSLGGTQAYVATAQDQHGNAMTGVTFTWSSSDPAIATIDVAGLATGVSTGLVTVTATASGVSGSATLVVAGVSIQGGGCSCSAADAGDTGGALLIALILGILLLRRRRHG